MSYPAEKRPGTWSSRSKTEMSVYPSVASWRAVERPNTPAPMMTMGSDLETGMMFDSKLRMRLGFEMRMLAWDVRDIYLSRQ